MNTVKSSARKAPNGASAKAIDIPELELPIKKNVKKIPSHANGGNGHAKSLDPIDTKRLLKVLTAVKNGDFTQRMPDDEVGINGKICDTLNEIISLNERMMDEFTKAGNTIGKQGKLTQRIEVPRRQRILEHRC